METFKLNNKNKETLKSFGYVERDFNQIELCANNAKFVNEYGKEINWRTARRVLGTESFLSTIARAAFHWDTEALKNGRCISVDFSEYIKKELL